jgi:hypothetical protein
VTGTSASGLPTGKRQHKPVSVTKPVDRSKRKQSLYFPEDMLVETQHGAVMPQTREHILLARQVGASGGTQQANRRYLYFAKVASFKPDGTPLRAIVDPALDDRRWRELLSENAMGPAVAAGSGPDPMALNPVALSAGSLTTVRGGMNAASAAGALKTIASAQTDYNHSDSWTSKWKGYTLDGSGTDTAAKTAKKAMRKKTAKKATKKAAFDHIGNFNFKVEIEGVTPGHTARKIPGRLKWSNITLKRGYIE